MQDIFGKHYKELKGNLYSMGGEYATQFIDKNLICRALIGICAQFEKGKKMGTCDLEINRLDVNYSTNTMKCALKFEVVNEQTFFTGW